MRLHKLRGCEGQAELSPACLVQASAQEDIIPIPALPPNPDMDHNGRYVRFVPKADIHAAVGYN